MKKAVAVTALCILLVLVPICTVYASQPFYYSMDIPAAITLKKSAQAKLCLSSPSGVQLGTAVFTVRYDPNVLTYKEADIADGMPGEMRAVEDGGLVKIVYLNANGTTLPTSEATPMILLRFTALSTQCKTTLTLYTEQAVDINEQKMTVQDPIEYQVTLQEKETTSSASASGRRVSASSAGSASSGVGSILVEGGAQEQPQLLVVPAVRESIRTKTILPQSHRHFQRGERVVPCCTIFCVFSNTVSWPNRRPIYDDARRQPQLVVWPRLRLLPETSIIFPQTHWHVREAMRKLYPSDVIPSASQIVYLSNRSFGSFQSTSIQPAFP